jgi:D-alanyl-D-alanine carboxypeptidase (penicillin-binding protein 5/6)
MNRPIGALAAFALWLLAGAAGATNVPAAPSVSAQTHVLMEAASGQVLAAEESDKPMPPASLTKLMTAYVVYEALADGSIAMTDKVSISEKAWRMGGSQMFLEVGSQATVDELLDGLVVQSGNDASVALAEHVAGSEAAFVEQMNHYAGELGLSNTHFENSEGLAADSHYASARDIAILARAIIQRFPERYQRYAKRSFSYNDIEQYNRNDLLWSDPHVDGLKTGYTRDADYCLAASAERDGMRLISVVMGAPSDQKRTEDSRSLLSWGFRFFERHELYSAGEVLEEARLWYGARDRIPLGVAEALEVTIPKNRYDALEAEMVFDGRLSAPVDKGDRLGTVRVYLDDESIAEAPLVALEAIPAGNLFQRAVDTVWQWFG